MYEIGNIQGLKREEIASIENLVDFVLPQDYLDFLLKYGYGEINENLMFQQPDEQYLKNNFLDYLDFWDWESKQQIDTALKGLTISTTIGGDIICCIENRDLPYLLLPRHSEKLVAFGNLESLFLDYLNSYKFEELYFDSYHKEERKYIPLIGNGQLDKNRIDKIHKSFLEKYSFDRVFRKDTQPKYVMQEIGGWIYFDLIFKSGIRVKFQSIYELKAKEIIEFLERQIV